MTVEIVDRNEEQVAEGDMVTTGGDQPDAQVTTIEDPEYPGDTAVVHVEFTDGSTEKFQATRISWHLEEYVCFDVAVT